MAKKRKKGVQVALDLGVSPELVASRHSRAAGYIRVSTTQQAEHGLGLDIQREAIAKYCADKGLMLVRVYEDAGVSGSNGPGLREAWADLTLGLDAKEFGVVVVLRLDRLARDLMLQEAMLADVQRRGGVVVSVDGTDLTNDDPGRVAFRQMIGVLAQYEKALIVLRLAAGRRAKRHNGGYAGGWVPYGYEVEGEGYDAKAVVLEEEAKVVRAIFEAAASGVTHCRIAQRLKQQGVPTKRGGQWAPATITTIVRNPFYIGLGGDGRQNGHEELVKRDLWASCQ